MTDKPRERETRMGTVVGIDGDAATVLVDGIGEARCRMAVPCSEGDRVAVSPALGKLETVTEGGR